jgi:hypothetical protein
MEEYGWNIYSNPYEEAHIDDTIIYRYMYQTYQSLNWAPPHLQLGKINTRWYTPSYTASYPLTDNPVVQYYT